MNNLTKREKLDFILKYININKTTAYEVGNNTDLTIAAVDRIFKGKINNPQNSTINTIYDYLQKKKLRRIF